MQLDVAVELDLEPQLGDLQGHGGGKRLGAAATAFATACSISRCELTPTILRNLRMLRLSVSSSIRGSLCGLLNCCGERIKHHVEADANSIFLGHVGTNATVTGIWDVAPCF